MPARIFGPKCRAHSKFKIQCEVIMISYLTERITKEKDVINLLNAELNPICHLLALFGDHHILHVNS